MTGILDFISDQSGTIGLIFFLVFFLGVLVMVFRPGQGRRFQSYGDIPLMENDNEEAKNHD